MHLPFKSVDVSSYFAQIKKLDSELFSIIDMKNTFSQSEGFNWEEQGHWAEDSKLVQLLTDYVPMQTTD